VAVPGGLRMSLYRIGSGSRVQVKARSKIHDTTTVWDSVAGTGEASPDTLATEGAKARLAVDMTKVDAGDWLNNRKPRWDFELDAHPEAIYEVRAVRDVVRTGDTFTAVADGVLRWRGREVALTIQGKGTMTATSIDATGTFDLDIKQLGLRAPRFLMIKM